MRNVILGLVMFLVFTMPASAAVITFEGGSVPAGGSCTDFPEQVNSYLESGAVVTLLADEGADPCSLSHFNIASGNAQFFTADIFGLHVAMADASPFTLKSLFVQFEFEDAGDGPDELRLTSSLGNTQSLFIGGDNPSSIALTVLFPSDGWTNISSLTIAALGCCHVVVVDDIVLETVPEPAVLGLLAAGAVALARRRAFTRR